MGWWTMGFSVMFLFGTLISAGIEGQNGLAATNLTVAMSATNTVMNVADNSGFLDSDYLFIENEIVYYPLGSKVGTTQITNLTRGIDNTAKKAHDTGVKVYNDTSSVINEVVGFNIAATNSQVGSFSALISTGWALLQALPRLVLWDYSFLSGTGPMQIIKWFLYCISAGFVITWIMVFLQLAQTIFKR